MRRILSVVLTVAMGVMFAVAMYAQADAASSAKPLTANQWKRGIAIVGQHAALDGRYGRAESELPENYTLDDLNKVYKTAKWKSVYSVLKAKESNVGTMQQLKDIASEYTSPNIVERSLKAYIASHPEKSAPAAVTAPGDAAISDGEAAPADTMNNDEVAVINASAGRTEEGGSRGVSMFIDIVLFLISAVALYMAWMARHENAELKKELEYKNNKMASQFEKFSKNITTDLNRVTYKVNKRRVADGTEGTISFNDDGGAAEICEPVLEPRKYFLTKPDANDYFMRATDGMEVGNSIYELCTFDGLTGTFRVIDNADVHHFALMMPTENLARACTGNAIQISNGNTRIVTDRDGTARFENGKWHVAVKAIIHYEA